MAEVSRSMLAPLEAMSFRTCVAVGAGLGLLAVGLIGARGPRAPADPVGTPAPLTSEVGTDTSTRDSAAGEHEPTAASARDARAAAGEYEAGPESDHAGQADPSLDPDGNGENDDAMSDHNGDTVTGETDADERSAAPSDADADADADDADGLVIDADSNGANDEKPERSADDDALPPSRQPDAESTMTAAELREAAALALSEKRHRDAYRLATRSDYKERSERTLVIKGKAACGMKDDKAAKAALKRLPRGDDRRKEIRSFCRDRGVRLGL